MSPLQIRIMLHYSYSAVDWGEPSNASRQAIGAFVGNGMLTYNAGTTPNHFITEKGTAFVNKLRSIPAPTETVTYTFEDEI